MKMLYAGKEDDWDLIFARIAECLNRSFFDKDEIRKAWQGIKSSTQYIEDIEKVLDYYEELAREDAADLMSTDGEVPENHIINPIQRLRKFVLGMRSD